MKIAEEKQAAEDAFAAELVAIKEAKEAEILKKKLEEKVKIAMKEAMWAKLKAA